MASGPARAPLRPSRERVVLPGWAGHGAGSGRGTGRAVGGASPWGGAWRQRLAGAARTGHRVGAPGPEPLRSAAGTGGCAAPAPPAGRPRTPVSAPTAPPHPAYPRSPATAPGVPPAPQGAPRTPGPSPGPTAPVSPQAGRPPGPRGPVSLPQGAGGVPGGYFWAVARQPPGSARRPHVTGAAGPRRRSHSSRRPGSSGTAGAPAQTGRDGRRHFLPAGELLGAGEGQLSPAGLPALPRALPAPLPARLLPQLLRQLPAGPRQRRPPVLPALRAPLGGEGGHRAAPRGPAPAVLGGQLSRQRGGRAVRQLRPALRQGGAGHHVLLQHLRAAPLRPVPRGDPPRQDVRPPRDCLALQAHQRRPQEVPPARGALHHVLHREEVHALHQLLQGHAGGEPGALHRHRDGVHAGLPAPGPGGDGGQGRRVRGRGDTGARGCPQRRSRPAAPGQAVKELQTSTREAIVLLKAMIEEVHNSASEEEAAINSLFGRMQEQLSERKKTLLKAVQSQHEEKEKAFKEQLAHLASLLPTLQVHLVTCSAFLSSANKAEFLDLGYQLMERLQRIVKLPHRLRPAQTSKINSEYRAEFARCLEPLLMLSPRRSVVGSAGGIGPGIAGTNMLPVGQCSKTLMVPSCPPAGDKTSTSPLVRKPTMHRYISTKVLLAEGRETPFAEHCRNYESTYRALQLEIQGLKDQVQELHRDLTKHHSLIKTEIMSEILQKSLQMDVQIAAHYSAVEMMRSVFEEVWEETYQRVANEQEIYEAQLHDLLQLRQENSCLTTITKQIAPYVRSIAKVKERLEPRLQEPREPKEEQAQMLLKVCDDSEAAPRDTSPGSSEGAPASPGEGCTPRDPPPKSKECRRGQPSGAESAAQLELAP